MIFVVFDVEKPEAIQAFAVEGNGTYLRTEPLTGCCDAMHACARRHTLPVLVGGQMRSKRLAALDSQKDTALSTDIDA